MQLPIKALKCSLGLAVNRLAELDQENKHLLEFNRAAKVYAETVETRLAELEAENARLREEYGLDKQSYSCVRGDCAFSNSCDYSHRCRLQELWPHPDRQDAEESPKPDVLTDTQVSIPRAYFEALIEDQKRLDWLEKHCFEPSDLICLPALKTMPFHNESQGLREAIDKEISFLAKQEKEAQREE